MARAPWLIVGCGYTGARLARRLLADGHAVTATRRTAAGLADLAALGVAARVVDLDRPATLAGVVPPGAIVASCAPPAADPAGEVALVEAAAAAGGRRLVYVSSTGVYPAGTGGWTDETTEPAPIGDVGVRRLAAERAILASAAAAGVTAVALRAAGIYGPGRGVHARLRAGTYRVIGAGDRFVSRVHVDDLVAAILAAAQVAAPPSVVNVADDLPTTARAHADGVAALLGLPPAPSVSPSEASAEARAMLLADRRVGNRRLREELGVAPRYPTWREGTLASVAEETGGR